MPALCASVEIARLLRRIGLLVRRLDLPQFPEDRRRVLHDEAEEPFLELRAELPGRSWRRRQAGLGFEQHRQPRAAVGQRGEEPVVLPCAPPMARFENIAATNASKRSVVMTVWMPLWAVASSVVRL